MASQIAKLVKRHDLDGITIEIWSSIQDAGREPVAHFMHHLADALHADNKILILVIPPNQDWFKPNTSLSPYWEITQLVGNKLWVLFPMVKIGVLVENL